MKKIILFLLFNQILFSQNISLNHSHLDENLRVNVLNKNINSDYSFTVRPINIENFRNNDKSLNVANYTTNLLSNKNKSIRLNLLPVDYFISYDSHHPYNRNNGSMIPNRGYQHIVSAGIFFKLGPLSIKLNPEHHFSENKDFEGFGEGPNGHYPIIWAKRYQLWNSIDMPERFGLKRHNRKLIGQSNIKINYKGISLGISNENLWWGPSMRNSIMLSNHAEGFKHITFNSNRPINVGIGNVEWQLISGRLESSRFTPPRTDFMYAGTKLYVPKINQQGKTDDWRYMQGLIFTYSPKWINGLHLGFIRWVQMYSALVEGKYWWMEGEPTYFPIFKNLFRKNDKYENYEAQTNQAAGLFFRWEWLDSKAEIYAEFHHNDAKENLRDLFLDSDHSRAATIGLQKIFTIKRNDYLFSWEWTQMEQTAGRIIRNASSWYRHRWVFDGYTNRGEVLGSGIGPGSNSHYFSFDKIGLNSRYGVAIEIIDNDNDFNYEAFESANDFRRYWKDLNVHLKFIKNYNNIFISSNLIYSKNFNYQWDLDDTAEPYYHKGNDTSNLHFSLKISYSLGNLN